MNRHAEKLLKQASPEESVDVDQTLEGTILAVHFCPRCGKVESERE